MAKLLKICCCCTGADEDDEQYLVLNHDEQDADDNIFPSSQPNGQTSIPYGGPVQTGNRLEPPVDPTPKPNREQQEAEIVNKIISRAQKSIIEVTSTDEISPDVTIAQRSREYSDLIRTHDINVKKKSRNNESEPKKLLISTANSTNPDVHAAIVSKTDLDFIREASEAFNDSVSAATGIENVNDMVAFMGPVGR